ncbi:MAG: cytochrome c biogenesis protein CcsA [Chthonomonadales bacterium]|nr:cytochrome c biogenesis protein CcsA [Chthonomonadales bacterium]
MRFRGLWWKAATALWMCAAIAAAFVYVGPVQTASGQPVFTMGGHGAKLIFFHVPCAWMACVAYVAAAWYAARYLARCRRPLPAGPPEDDLKSAAAMELGLLFAVLATVTGSIFSHNEWGMYWSWDPRQTSIVVVMLLFAGYLVLRGALDDPGVRARLSAAYAVVAVVPALFLIWVLPRIVETLHGFANEAVFVGLGASFRLVLYGLALPAFIGLFTWMFQLRLRAMKLEWRRDEAP